MPLRLAFVTTEFGELGTARGGLGYHLARVVPLLAAAGHECEVFLCSGELGDEGAQDLRFEGALVRRLSASGVTPFDGMALPRPVLRHLRSAWRIAEQLAASEHARFDVVQAPNYGVSSLFLDIPVPLVMRFSSHAPTWHAAAGAPRDLRVTLGEALQRRAITDADAHLAPSRFVADLVEREYGLPVEVMRPPAPLETDRSRWDVDWARGATGGARYVLHAGQLGRAKGTDLVMASAERFLREVPELHLHLCGRDAGARDEIERLRRRFGERVRHHGRVSADRLHPLMAAATAVLTPSRADNLPNVVIEAMSLGTPVVGVRGASIDELVVDGKSGFLAAPQSGAELAAAVQRVVSLSDDARRRMGEEARRHVERLLEPREAVDRLASAYARAASRPARLRRPRAETAAEIRSELSRAAASGRSRSLLRGSWRRVLSLFAGR